MIYQEKTIEELSANQKALDALEEGELVYFPKFSFDLEPNETVLFKKNLFPFKRKNIGYNIHAEQLKAAEVDQDTQNTLKNMMHRYALFSQKALTTLIPHYTSGLEIGRTSFRPVEIEGRKVFSYRRNDTRLHVDSFPRTPCQGKRILRVFANVNPNGQDRVWRIGDRFESVVDYFKPLLKRPPFFYKHLLKQLKLTEGLCSDYDALMLQIHNAMKSNMHYQKTVKQETIRLAPGSLWIVFTDKVSHAAMSGQYCLEQTFTLPVESMKDPSKSPLHILQKAFGRNLV